MFVNVDGDGFDLGAQRKENGKNDLPEILNSLKKYKEWVLNEGEIKEDELFNINIVGKSRIKENGDYNLSGNRYQSSERGIYVKGKWEMVELDDVCSIESGSRSKGGSQDSGVPSIGGAQIDENGGIRTNSMVYISEEHYNSMNKGILREGDVLVVKDGATTGKTAYYNRLFDKAAINEHVFILRSKAGIVNSKYLFYVIKSEEFQNKLKPYIKGMIGGICLEIKEIKIPLPPIEEQKKIVEELDRYQRIIDGARMVIDNWKPDIEIDPAWDVVTLGNEFRIESGGTPDTSIPEYWDGDIKWVTLVDIPEVITGINDTARRITEEGLNKSSAKLLPKGTVLVSTRATIGRIGVAEDEIATNQGFKNVIVNEDNNPYFVAHMLKRKVPEMILLASGGTFKEISKTNFATIQIPLPPRKIQDKIVSTIMEGTRTIDANKKLIEKSSKSIEGEIALLF